MDDKQRAELRRIRKLKAQAGVTQQKREQVAEASRAVQPTIDAWSDQALEAAEVSERFRLVMRRVVEMYSAEVQRMMPQLAQMAREVADAQVERSQRQIQDFVAGYAAQAVEMSRQLQRVAAAQIVSASIPRVEVFRPTLDRLVAQMEITYPPYLTPAPAGEMAAPAPQLEPDALSQDDLEPFISDVAVQSLLRVIVFLLIMAVLWQALTGQWRFEDLLDYLSQQIDQTNPTIDPNMWK